MFSSTVNERLKEYIYKNLRENAEQNLPSVIKRLLKDIDNGDNDKVKDSVGVVKHMIKDKLPAKPKFYALILLKEMMETKDKYLVEYFTKKMLNRLFYLAQFESKNKDDLSRGERCLKRYYSQDSKENREYSLKFFILLLECWKHWDEMFGPSNKKIRQKTDKLRQLFPLNDLYYNYLDSSYKHEANPQSKSPNAYLSVEKQRDREREPLNMSRSYESNNHTLSESMHRSEEIQKKVLTFYQIREALFPVVRENDAEEIEDILQDLYHSLKTQLELLQRHKTKVMQSQRYSEKFRMRFLRETDIANSIIELFDKYYRGSINYKEFQNGVRDLEDDIQKKSLDKFSQVGRDDKGNFGTVSSLNDTESLESSRRMFKSPEVRYEPKSEKNMSKSLPSVSVKPSPRESYGKQKSDDKYQSGFDKSTGIIREVKEEDEEDDDNFDDEKWKELSDFKPSPNINKDSQFNFEDTKKATSKLNSPDYEFEPRGSTGNFENDFHDFNEKVADDRFNNLNQMATIEEESREDYESKLSFTRAPPDSKVTNKGISKHSRDQSFKQVNKLEDRESNVDIKFDDFTDFGFKQHSPTNQDKEWMNFTNNSSYNKSSQMINVPKTEPHDFHQSLDWNNSKDFFPNFKKPITEAKSQKNISHKAEIDHKNTKSPFSKQANNTLKRNTLPPKLPITENSSNLQPKSQKHLIPDISVVSHQEDDTLPNFSNMQKPSTAKKDSNFYKPSSITERQEIINTYTPNDIKENYKSNPTKRYSDEEFESFNHNQDISADADPFSQFKVDTNISQDNSEINRNLEKNMMTFGTQQFNSIMDMQKRTRVSNLEPSEGDRTDRNINDNRENEEPLDENAFEFQFETNEPGDQNEGFGFDNNFAMPQFEKSMENNLLRFQNYADDQPFSDYSYERSPVEIPIRKIQQESPVKTKVIKIPESQAKNDVSIEEDKIELMQLPVTPEIVEKEIADLRIHKEHYRQQCDFLFGKLLALQKEQTRHRLNRTQDRSMETVNAMDEDEFDIYQNKIINRKNDYLQKENLMLKKLNKDLVETNNAMTDKKELENGILKKLVNEMEAYISELQGILGKIIRQ